MWKDAAATFKDDTHNMPSNLNTGIKYYTPLLIAEHLSMWACVPADTRILHRVVQAGHVVLH